MNPPVDPVQCRALKCGYCLSNLFEQLAAGPILQDRLKPENLHFTPGLAFRCAGCLKLFDPAKCAQEKREIIPS
jgi:hypothetical protein